MHRKLFSYNDQEIYLFLYETWQEFNVLCFSSLNDTADTMITKIQDFLNVFLERAIRSLHDKGHRSIARSIPGEDLTLGEPLLLGVIYYGNRI